MSPELIKGIGYDMRTDVWGFAAVIYEMVELDIAFYHRNEQKIKKMILKGEF